MAGGVVWSLYVDYCGGPTKTLLGGLGTVQERRQSMTALCWTGVGVAGCQVGCSAMQPLGEDAGAKRGWSHTHEACRCEAQPNKRRRGRRSMTMRDTPWVLETTEL